MSGGAMIALTLMLCVTNAPLAARDDAAPPSPPSSSPAPSSPAPSSPAPSSAAPSSPAPSSPAPSGPAPSDTTSPASTSTTPAASSPDIDITTAPQSPPPPPAPSPATTTTSTPVANPPSPAAPAPVVERDYPGVIGWTGIAIGASGLVVAGVAGTYAAVMNGIEGDPTSTRDDKQLAFDTHGVAGTVALAGLGATTIGALVFAADFAAPQ